MIFSSTVFLFFFLPVTLVLYYVVFKKYRNYWLLLVSLLFFSWSQPNYLWIILLNIAINYSASIIITRCNGFRKPIFIGAIVANLIILFYFKYFDFAIDSVNKLLNKTYEIGNIVLPIGISFFTFQGLSYTADVYRNRIEAEKNPFKVALYITLFPQLIAGPIVRYTDIAGEIDDRKESIDDFCYGIERFIIGLSKKSIIANTMAAFVDGVWNSGIDHNTALTLWVGSIAYTLQIYYDFSGYSDMAIGLGRMLGFKFNENFNLPYVSKSVSEFWRRWHISLSSWFRDYVYIPMGGNRNRVYLNLIIVFLLTGLWHGASWHFIIWGGWNGIFVLTERWITENNHYLKKIIIRNERVYSFLSKLYTLFVINIGWILFRAPHTRDAINYIVTMFGIYKPERIDFELFWYFDKWTIVVMIVGCLFASSVPKKIIGYVGSLVPGKETINVLKYFMLVCLLYLSMLRIVSGTYNPFIYFQF